MRRYCAFCRSGSEETVAADIRRVCPEETPVTIVPHRIISERREGKWCEARKQVYPGYIFIFSEDPLPVHLFGGISNFYKMLRYSDGSCELFGRDAEIADWLYEYDGLLQISDVAFVGKNIRIVSGPLRDVAGVIESIDRRKRRVSVKIEFAGSPMNIVMGINELEVQD